MSVKSKIEEIKKNRERIANTKKSLDSGRANLNRYAENTDRFKDHSVAYNNDGTFRFNKNHASNIFGAGFVDYASKKGLFKQADKNIEYNPSGDLRLQAGGYKDFKTFKDDDVTFRTMDLSFRERGTFLDNAFKADSQLADRANQKLLGEAQDLSLDERQISIKKQREQRALAAGEGIDSQDSLDGVTSEEQKKKLARLNRGGLLGGILGDNSAGASTLIGGSSKIGG